MVLSGNRLFGTARYGGKSDRGTVFALDTDGTAFTNLHSFTNNDGSSLYAGLASFGNTLYGAAAAGGISGYGTVFKLNTDGTGFSLLHSFSSLSGPQGNTNSDGIEPFGGVIFSGDILYGTAFYGGNFGYGTVFSISLPLPPQLTIIRSGTNVILTWPTNAPGFTLQSTTNLAPPSVWNTVSPSAVVVDGQNTVTNPTSSSQKFYRLFSN
jgi:uncharacterized repeat protein (TIGR03803 family)